MAGDAERAAKLEREVRRAFAGVTREGGMSWTDAWAFDGGERAASPTFPDGERSWEELIDDRRWDPDVQRLFPFLDPIGARYYLGPALVRALRAAEEGCGMIEWHLTRPPDTRGRRRFDADWAALTDEQWRCVRAVAAHQCERALEMGWTEAFDQWGAVTEGIDGLLRGRGGVG